MSGDASLSPPTGILFRFSLFIEAMKRGLMDDAGHRQLIGPTIGVLLNYITNTRRRLAALHARFAAGKLPAAPRRRATPRPAAERPGSERQAPAIPPGRVFLHYGLGAFTGELRDLLNDPEMRALLAAAPQAGRLLRPLWRKLTAEPLPGVLRLPPRPRKPRPPRPTAARTAPDLRPVASPDGTVLWEPTPCYPPFSAPPRLAPARAAGLPEPPPPAPAARPPAWGRPAPPDGPRIPPWMMRVFQR